MKSKKAPKLDSTSADVVGYLYRGPNREVEMGGYKIRLVQDQTYVLPYLKDPTNIKVTLKKEGGSIDLVLTAKEYYTYLSSGRSGYHDRDPYIKQSKGKKK